MELESAPRAENETRCCKTQPTGFFFVFFLAPKRQHSTPAPARQHALTARPAPATTQQWPTMHVARRQLRLVRAGPRWKSSSHAKALSYETKIKALPPHSTVSKPPRWHAIMMASVCLSSFSRPRRLGLLGVKHTVAPGPFSSFIP
jgi:hypothetical protein